MALIETQDFESVRKMINIQITSATLPDNVIDLDDFKGEAIRKVQAQTSNEDASAKRAARAYLAMLLIPAIPRVASESNAGYSYQLEKLDWNARLLQLEKIALDAIADSERANPTDVGNALLETLKITNFDVANSSSSEFFV